MKTESVIRYAELEQFLMEYHPLTPYGLSNKYNYKVCNELDILQSLFQSVDKAMQFICQDPFEADKLESILRNIPLISNLDNSFQDSAELFLIRKFIISYKAICGLIPEALKLDLEIKFSLQLLLDQITAPEDNGVSFYIHSSYDENLKTVRDKISDLEKQISEIKQNRIIELIELYGLDFTHCSFLLVEEEKASIWSTDFLYKEVYDNMFLQLKPIYPPIYFELHASLQEYINEEHVLEQKVLKGLYHEIQGYKLELEDAVIKIEKLDTSLAKARLAIRYGMVKPEVDPKAKSIEVVNGCFLPLLNFCKKNNTIYTPLTASFNTSNSVISGSNMGGKTVLLKTIGFLQLLAQMGFWVPADSFRTTLFENLLYIGPQDGDPITGLSSFGSEIHHLTSILDSLNSPTLILMDEFAKTTNSVEAQGLIAGLLKYFSQKETVWCFLSTHFMGLPKSKSVTYFRMKGFDQIAFEQLKEELHLPSYKERIRIINACMHYQLVKDDFTKRGYDALLIAELLGLDKTIIEYANNYIIVNYD